MNKFLLIASLLCVDVTTRDKLLGLFTGVSRNAYANETGVLKFALFVPRDEPDSKLLYSIEQYASQAAFESHLATKPVSEMFQWINSANRYSREPLVYNLTVSDELEFVRPEIGKQSDPYVVVQESRYVGTKLPLSLPFWKEVVSTSEHENGTFFTGVYSDSGNSSRLFSIEVCTNKEYYTGIHSRSDAYLQNNKNSNDFVNGTNMSILQMKGGFLFK